MMDSRERFLETMRLGSPDRVPYFEEGIRRDVIRAWRKQGLRRRSELERLFSTDIREEVQFNVDPLPSLLSRIRANDWPRSQSAVNDLIGRSSSTDPLRLPVRWSARVRAWRKREHVLMYRVHRGFFQTMGVRGWKRFDQLMYAIVDNPDAVRSYMKIHGELVARLLARALEGVTPDAIIFSEPIGGNHGPLISPRMYEDVVLSSYDPILNIARDHGVEVIILRTYANARALIPSMLKWGIHCLWACECAQDGMDYRSLRDEFGLDLRLIGGIDTDVLYLDKDAIKREVMETVPQLVADGGYVPLADGRVRKDVPFANYVYYRELLEEVTKSD